MCAASLFGFCMVTCDSLVISCDSIAGVSIAIFNLNYRRCIYWCWPEPDEFTLELKSVTRWLSKLASCRTFIFSGCIFSLGSVLIMHFENNAFCLLSFSNYVFLCESFSYIIFWVILRCSNRTYCLPGRKAIDLHAYSWAFQFIRKVIHWLARKLLSQNIGICIVINTDRESLQAPACSCA